MNYWRTNIYDTFFVFQFSSLLPHICIVDLFCFFLVTHMYVMLQLLLSESSCAYVLHVACLMSFNPPRFQAPIREVH